MRLYILSIEIFLMQNCVEVFRRLVEVSKESRRFISLVREIIINKVHA